MPGKKTASKFDPVPEEKTCKKCGETKPFDLFSKGKRYPHGRRPTCKKCNAAYVKSRSILIKKEQEEIESMKMTYPRIPDHMKQCRDCLEVMRKENFRKHKETKDGYVNQCNKCLNAKRPSRAGSESAKRLWKKYYEKNSERLNEKRRGCKALAEKSRKRYEKNKEYMRKRQSEYGKLPSAKALNAARQKKREQRKRMATPSWLTEEHLLEMKHMYWLAGDLKAVSGQEYHVDHIVPLKGKNVCGLHVPWNLQILPADLNYRKSNRLEGF